MQPKLLVVPPGRRRATAHLGGRTQWLLRTAVLTGLAAAAGCDGVLTVSSDAGLAGDGLTDGGSCAPQTQCGPFKLCCQSDEECINDWQCLPRCENQRCGSNSEVCCQPGEICLDGVECAVSCQPKETLCGAKLDTCCSSSEVCLHDRCLTPGHTCDNNFDCLDESWYCESTIKRCLPLPPGKLCQGKPTFTAIEPKLEWYWPGANYDGRYYQNIVAAPAVGDVTGDGTPELVVVLYHDAGMGKGIIAVLDGRGDGKGGGRLLFTIPSQNDPKAPFASSSISVALANFDQDPGLEIAYAVEGGGVRIADNDGVGDVCDQKLYPGCSGSRLKNISASPSGGVLVTDLDHDGVPDVVLRCQGLNGHNVSDPALDLINASGCGTTVVADLDQNGKPEIIDAQHALTVDPATPGGVSLWTEPNGQTAGFLAVADLLPGRPGPEVINIRAGFFLLDGQTGKVLIGPKGQVINATIPIPGGGTGGAPTVADFDGDGLPEVSTAGTGAYVVYDPDCWNPPARQGGQCASGSTDLNLWQSTTQDISSSQTGSSVFDFQGDGVAEVLYNDECFFHLYDGRTGAELVKPVLPSSSRTGSEYPLVADVDGDGNSEMIVISNLDQAINRDKCHLAWKKAAVSIDWLCQYTTCTKGSACTGGVGGTCDGDGYQCDAKGICQLPGGTHGVRVYGDAHDRWVKTRPVWNQFSYHVTDFEAQSGFFDVPVHETASWTTYNNYRQNVQGGALFPVPDLAVELTAEVVCPSRVNLMAKITNKGSAGAPAGLPVSFYLVDGPGGPKLLQSKNTVTTLLPGAWERVAWTYPVPDTDVEFVFTAKVAPPSSLQECASDNNAATSSPVKCEGID